MSGEWPGRGDVTGRTVDGVLIAVLLGAAVGVVVITWRAVAALLDEGGLVPAYLAPLYWLDYREGLVRRGLPGQLLTLVSAGAPSWAAVQVAALVLTVAGVVAVVALAWRLARLADAPVTRVAVGVLVAASPFVMLLLPGSIGRYDAVGVVAAAVVALLPLVRRLPPWPVAVALGLAVLVAFASEEFLGAYLVPVALAAAARLGAGRTGRTAAMAAVVLVPGAVVSVLGVLAPPGRDLIGDTLRLARTGGTPSGGRSAPNAVAVLDNTLQDQFALFEDFDRGALIALLVAFGVLFAAVAATVWMLVGRPVPRASATAGAWLALLALAVPVVGVDVGRWWALSFVGFVAFLAVLPPHPAPPAGLALRVWATAVALACVPATLLPPVPPLVQGSGPPRAAAPPVAAGVVAGPERGNARRPLHAAGGPSPGSRSVRVAAQQCHTRAVLNREPLASWRTAWWRPQLGLSGFSIRTIWWYRGSRASDPRTTSRSGQAAANARMCSRSRGE